MRRLADFLCLGLVACLAACGAPPIPFDRGATPTVNTIGVLTPGWPQGPTVHTAAVPMGGFLPVALAAAAAEAARESRFTKVLEAERFDAAGEFRTRLVAAVRARGYQVVEVPATADRGKYLETYPTLPNPPDAWLDCVVPLWGYVAANALDDTPYRPIVGMVCRLVRAGSGTVLMRDTVVYNPLRTQPASGGAVVIAPDPAFAFKTSDILMADPKKAVAGLLAGFDSSAEALGGLLK